MALHGALPISVRSIAAGDFTTVVKLRPGDETSLLRGIESLRQRLGTLIHDVRSTSLAVDGAAADISSGIRSEEHTSELQSLMRISYAVFCLKKNTKHNSQHANPQHT